MIKRLFLFISFLSIINFNLFAENDFNRYRINFLFENDIFNRTDEDYSSGESLSAIFYIDKPTHFMFNIIDGEENKSSDTYVNFAITNQIFTPTDISTKELIVDDHPYAGWTYFKMALLKSSAKQLNSLSLKIGMVGPYSGSENMQYHVHKIIGSDRVMGWNNQLNNELGINLQYLYKKHFMSKKLGSMEAALTPFFETQLGNISTCINTGAIIRVGWNIPKDFGFSNIDIGNEDGIPIYGERKNVKNKPWSFNFNITASGSAVARDIFLDGNTFSDSHSVEKEIFVGHFGYGFSVRYHSFILEFLGVVSSKKFKTANGSHAVGTTKIAYIF